MKDNKIYGLIGFPLGHSFSKSFFNEKFKEEGIHAEYRNFEIGDISQIRQIFSEVDGLNVTIPYKEMVMPYLSEIDATAEKIGSVNVIKIARCSNGSVRTKGYNTDIIGFSDSIKPYLRSHHQSALVLGTGGASKAVVCGLNRLGIATRLVSRSTANAALTYDDLTVGLIESTPIIVNTTPLGMFPKVDACPDIPFEGISSGHICFDLIYNPEETVFLKKARQRQAVAINGLDMLIGQAIAAWKIWNE